MQPGREDDHAPRAAPRLVRGGTREAGHSMQPGSQRGVVLQGLAALTWFADQGHTVDSGQHHLATDVLVARGFRLCRIWHTAGSLTSDRVRPRVLLQLEGTSHLRIGDTARPLPAGSLAYVPAGRRLVIASETPVARMEVELPQLPLLPGVLETLERRLVLDASQLPLGAVLIAGINTALNGDLEAGDAGFPSLRLAFGHLTSAALSAAVGQHAQEGTSRQKDLFDSALTAIETEASDPGFSVARLAQTLRVSQPYLRTVFAAHRTTARAEIRARRAALAREYLEAHGEQPLFTAGEAARLSGFRDVDTMRAALRATTPPPDNVR